MKRIKYILISCMFLAGFQACNDSFLDEKPDTFYTLDDVFTSSGQVDQVLVSIYSHLRDLKANPDEASWINVLKGQGTDMYDVSVINKSHTFSDYSIINPDHDNFFEIYSTWYYIISRANLALYAAGLPNLTWETDSEKAYVIAQARFFRALAHKNLAELFGGVSIVTEIAIEPRFDYARATRVETYQFAITEMEAILNDLPETTGSGGRVVRGAAQHNLCELYLAMGTQLAADGKASEAQAAFASSVKYADQVIDGGIYKLMTSRFGARANEQTVGINVYRNGVAPTAGNPTIVDTVAFTANCFWDMFQEGNVNYQDGNSECIWAAQIDYDAYRQEDGKSKLPYSHNFGPVFRDQAGRWLAGMMEDVGGRGTSGVNITMYTRDDIYAGNFARDLRNSDAVFRRRFKGNKEKDIDGKTDNPYYRQIIPWDLMYNGASDETTNKNNRSILYPVSCKISTDKYTGLEDGEVRNNLFRDEYFIRLAETILLRAEAKQRSGDKAGAAADINLLRERAQCAYKVTAADMDDHFNMILDERARELVYEEYRWNTLLRMGGTIAVDRIRKYAYWPETAATLTFNYNLWPIPQTIIDTNKDVKLEQNPGWENR